LQQQQSDIETKIVKRILRYFVHNPTAADSLEGVARWRLLEEQIQNSVLQTDAALTWLVSQGFLQEVKPAGAVALFRLDPKRRADAIRFLEEQDQA